jgi:ABC-type branched-subunit amino acid transport system ATPase component
MLSIEKLTAGYGSAPVITGLSLRVATGEVLAVLGRNGSGKSTLAKAVIGVVPEISGSICIGEKQVVGLPAHRVARLGVAYVPQGRGIFPRLTVRENLELGTRARRDRQPTVDDAIFCHFPVLRHRLDQQGGTMSGGEQQMLAIARAICAKPDVLLMDEPSDGIAPMVVDLVADLLPNLASDMSLAIMLVEQNIDLALAAASRCIVLDRGSIVHEGTPDAFRDPETVHKYLAI